MSDTPPDYPQDLNNVRFTRSMVSSTSGQRAALQMKMSSSSYIKLSTENIPEETTTILLHMFKSRGTDIYIYIPELRPEWVSEDWFFHLAGGLIEYQVKLTIKDLMRNVGHRRVAHARGLISRYAKMDAITAVAMTMKIKGNIDAFATVFSFFPLKIAEDFRICRMGTAIGTQATCVLLTSIFNRFSINRYIIKDRDSEFIIAAAYLLVTHIGRDDHRIALTIHSQNPRISFEKLLGTITPDCKDAHGVLDVNLYINMASVREGIIFGAMLLYAKDIPDLTQQHVDILDLFGRTALTMITAGITTVPGGKNATNIVTAGGNKFDTFVSMNLPRRNTDPTLSGEIRRNFFLAIEYATHFGFIPGFRNNVSVNISTGYARSAKGIMKCLADP